MLKQGEKGVVGTLAFAPGVNLSVWQRDPRGPKFGYTLTGPATALAPGRYKLVDGRAVYEGPAEEPTPLYV